MLTIDRKHARINQVRAVFYIYTEAPAAVFMLLCALAELVSSYFVPAEFFQSFARWAAVVFAVLAVVAALWVVRKARAHGVLSAW